MAEGSYNRGVFADAIREPEGSEINDMTKSKEEMKNCKRLKVLYQISYQCEQLHFLAL